VRRDRLKRQRGTLNIAGGPTRPPCFKRFNAANQIRSAHIGHGALSEIRKQLQSIRSAKIEAVCKCYEVAKVHRFNRHSTWRLACKLPLAIRAPAIADD